MQNVVLIFLFSAIALWGNAQTYTTEEGLATFYSNKFHGRKTSSGEVYRKTKLTAAHPNLPFGTEVKVTNIDNGKSVIVRINDRCSPRRIAIDLSKAAAAKIDMIGAGMKMVRIEVVTDSIKQSYLAQEINTDTTGADSTATLSPNLVSSERTFSVQVASVATLKNANRLTSHLTSTYNVVSDHKKVKTRRGRSLYKVLVGAFSSRDEASTFLSLLKKTYPTAFIIPFK